MQKQSLLLIFYIDVSIPCYSFSNFYNNGGAGVKATNNGDGKGKFFIDDVVSKNNGANGFDVGGSGTIRDVKAVNNNGNINGVGNGNGMIVVASKSTNITLDGQVYLNNNVFAGLNIYYGSLGNPIPGIVNVVGDLIAERNGPKYGYGIVNYQPKVDVVLGSSSSGKSGKVGSSGSVKACMNGDDITYQWPAIDDNFVGEDYTCDRNITNCNKCYPGCSP